MSNSGSIIAWLFSPETSQTALVSNEERTLIVTPIKVKLAMLPVTGTELSLPDLRRSVGVTQVKLAETLEVKQPTISNYEQPDTDNLISTLMRYVEALGGELHLVVKFP